MRKYALSFLSLALAAPLAMAAPKPQPPAKMQMPAPAASAPSVDTATLHKFANAYEDVMQVRTKYIVKLKAAKTKDKKTAIKKQASQEMKQDISKHMSVKKYMQVAKAVNANPKLRQELIKIIRSDSKKGSSGLRH